MKTHDLIQLFLHYQKGVVMDVTVRWYQRYLTPLDNKFGDKDISAITHRDLHDLFLAKQQNSHSVYTLLNYLRVWKRFFRWSYDEGHITSNPAQELKRPRIPPKTPQAISEENIQKLLEYSQNTTHSERDYALILFLADTGARVGGVSSLTMQNLDFERCRAIVCEKGRGGKKERVVFLSERLVRALREWLAVRPDTEDKRVFLLAESGIYQVLKRLNRQAGLTGRWNPHSFRHAFARRMLARGMSLGVVSHLMGHSSVQVTIDFYGRFSVDELQEIYNRYIRQ
jgi:integrase/recombinase XerD